MVQIPYLEQLHYFEQKQKKVSVLFSYNSTEVHVQKADIKTAT